VIRVPSDTRIRREIGWRTLSHRRKVQAPGQVDCAGESASCEVSCMSGHSGLLCDAEPISRNKLYSHRDQDSRAAKACPCLGAPREPRASALTKLCRAVERMSP